MPVTFTETEFVFKLLNGKLHFHQKYHVLLLTVLRYLDHFVGCSFCFKQLSHRPFKNSGASNVKASKWHQREKEHLLHCIALSLYPPNKSSFAKAYRMREAPMRLLIEAEIVEE